MAGASRRAVVLLALAAAGCARRYPVQGMVVRTGPGTGVALIAHRAIPGYMPAMAMEFRARTPSDFDALRPGARVSFTLRNGMAERVRVAGGAFDPREVDLTQAPPQPRVGDPLPDFTLTSHRGARVSLASLRGRWVVVNFIYTRCPLPEVCPRLTAAFAAMQRRFAGMPLTFLSVTLDPRFDTPEVLEAYARRAGAKAGWHFLTGSAGEVEGVAREFGLFAWVEEGVIVHSSSTALIDPEGRLAALVEGSSFALEEFAGLLRYSLTSR